MGRLRGARKGKVNQQPCGFPQYCTKDTARIVTADPWALLLHLAQKHLPKKDEPRAIAFIEQASDFYKNAAHSNSAGKPLLYYYAFLNLFKAALLIKKVAVPQVLKHGISDPRANSRQRLRLAGQQVLIPGRARDRSEFFPELLCALGWESACNRRWKVLDLLALIPSIHRTYCKVEDSTPEFLPLKQILLVSDQSNVWARLVLSNEDRDAVRVRPIVEKRSKFTLEFSPVSSSETDVRWYESRIYPAHGKARVGGIQALASNLRLQGIATILTSSGYRYYISSRTPAQFMPRLAAAYAVFFYLGSITRYKPYDFDKIVDGKYRWIVEELLATEPSQLLYSTCSWLAEVEVVKPYAVI